MLFRYEEHGKETGYSACGPKDREEAYRCLCESFDLAASLPKEERSSFYSEWAEDLRRKKDAFWRLALGRYLLRMRETLGLAAYEDLESDFLQYFPDVIRAAVLCQLLLEFSSLLPKAANRLESLRALPAVEDVPEKVSSYLAEATRCFLYGSFSACAMLCRSSVDFGLRDRLVKSGFAVQLHELEQCGKATYAGVLDLCRLKLPWSQKDVLNHAEDVIKKANRAVHNDVLTADEVRYIYELTRGVLRDLYS